MRTLMMFEGIVAVIVGTFCMANYGATFLSVAFVVGASLVFSGICEILVDKIALVRDSRGELGVRGIMLLIMGIVFVTGTVPENMAVMALFAFMLIEEGMKLLASVKKEMKSNTAQDNIFLVVGALCIIVGLYMFFNQYLFHLNILGLVGASMFLLGLCGFRYAINLEYRRPSFITGTHERLSEAREMERRGMKKAKEGVRETKIARERIQKLNRQMAREKHLVLDEDQKSRSKK